MTKVKNRKKEADLDIWVGEEFFVFFGFGLLVRMAKDVWDRDARSEDDDKAYDWQR